MFPNCYVFHDPKSNNGKVIDEGYQNIKRYLDNGKLMGVVTHISGFSAMPNGTTKLLHCHIEMIQSWINNEFDDGLLIEGIYLIRITDKWTDLDDIKIYNFRLKIIS